MPHYAVHSGNILRCVVADDATAAAIAAVRMHINEADDPAVGPCEPGEIFEVAELGKRGGDNMLILSRFVREGGSFRVGVKDNDE